MNIFSREIWKKKHDIYRELYQVGILTKLFVYFVCENTNAKNLPRQKVSKTNTTSYLAPNYDRFRSR